MFYPKDIQEQKDIVEEFKEVIDIGIACCYAAGTIDGILISTQYLLAKEDLKESGLMP
jgi:hypothetical protein